MKEYTAGSLVRAGIWGALIGGATGFALGLLLAPEEGQKIRRRLTYQLENLADQVNTFVENMVHPEVPGDARQKGDAIVADARNRAQRIQDDIDALMGEVRRHGPSGTPASN
ncbi:MAG: YtxH domain-containing protein [Rhodothermales bacterium]